MFFKKKVILSRLVDMKFIHLYSLIFFLFLCFLPFTFYPLITVVQPEIISNSLPKLYWLNRYSMESDFNSKWLTANWLTLPLVALRCQGYYIIPSPGWDDSTLQSYPRLLYVTVRLQSAFSLRNWKSFILVNVIGECKRAVYVRSGWDETFSSCACCILVLPQSFLILKPLVVQWRAGTVRVPPCPRIVNYAKCYRKW